MFLSNVAIALVLESDDTRRIRCRGSQSECRVHVVWQNLLPAAETDRIQMQMQLVHEIVREQGMNEVAAAVRYNVFSGFRLQRANGGDDVFANDCRIPPRRLLERS